MSSIRLQQDHRDTTTRVPNLFIDHYMTMANGEFVKVYLYLLRAAADPACECTVSNIADHCNLTERDALRALRYWENTGLLALTYDSDHTLDGISLLAPQDTLLSDTPYAGGSMPVSADRAVSAASPAENASDLTGASAQNASDLTGTSAQDASDFAAGAGSSQQGADTSGITSFHKPDAVHRREYSADEIDRFRKDPDVSECFYIIETYLKHPLNSTETNTILYWMDQLHFQIDLIIYLVEYSISKGHSAIRYMDRIAMNWSDAGVSTVEDARQYSAAHSKAYYAVQKAFGISGRSLTDEEMLYVKRWTKEYHFDLPLVLEACRRTIAATHQPSFPYAEAILSDWHSHQVHTMEDVQILDTEHMKSKNAPSAPKEKKKRNKFNNFNQRDYDYNQLEKLLLNSSVQ